jgi:hypothetical protein
MRLLGAEVRPVEFGTRTLKEATSEAIRDWITNVETTYYLIGSCVGPSPYPEIVRELQRVIGREAREQILAAEGRLPEAVVACVGGGSNAIGAFYDFVPDENVRLIGVEAAGAASLGTGRPGVLHGARSSVLADEDGQIADAHSISAGLAAHRRIEERRRDGGHVRRGRLPHEQLAHLQPAPGERIGPHLARINPKSLSPRPERHTRISSASRSAARASACDDSSAGTMPSVAQRRWNAASASSSVAVT